MDIRKIQKTGRNTFIVSLPIQWVKEHGLQKKTPVGVIPRADGTLLITLVDGGQANSGRKTFVVENDYEEHQLFRRLVAAYIMGFREIKVCSEKELPSRVRRIVRDFTSIAIGQEVTEEDLTSITVKDLLNPMELPFESSVGRMHIILKSMIDDTLSYLGGGEESFLEDVINRDTDLDRLHWLISRQSVMAVKDPTFVEKMNVNGITAVMYALISRHMERIGDHAVRIAKNLREMRGRLNPEARGGIVKALNSAEDLFDGAITSLLEKDISAANDVIERTAKIHRLSEDIIHAAHIRTPEDLLTLGHVADSIRRMGDYSGDICESVINIIVMEEN